MSNPTVVPVLVFQELSSLIYVLGQNMEQDQPQQLNYDSIPKFAFIE